MERLLPEVAHRGDFAVGSVGAACRKGQRVSIVPQLIIAKIPLSDSSLSGEYEVRTCLCLASRKGRGCWIVVRRVARFSPQIDEIVLYYRQTI